MSDAVAATAAAATIPPQRSTNTRRPSNNTNSRRPGNTTSSSSASDRHLSDRVDAATLTPTQLKRAPSPNDLALLMKSGALISGANVSQHMLDYMFDAHTLQQLAARHAARQTRHRGAKQRSAAAVETVEATFDLRRMWCQLNLAAAVLAGVVNTGTQVLFVASNERAAVGASCAARTIGAQSIIGRFVPGTLSNPSQATFREPVIIVCASANEDVQAIKESAGSNVSIIAFCDSTANLTNVEVPIPCNTKGRLSIGLMFYLLARQTLRHKGALSYDNELDLTVDSFIQKTKKQTDDQADEEEEEEREGIDAVENEIGSNEGLDNNVADGNWQ